MANAIACPAGLSGAEIDTLWCLFLHGPTGDGEVPSKVGRSSLVERGFADRGHGLNWLTSEGVQIAIDMGFDDKKERRANAARR